jgi:hypothetical protein
MRIHSFFLCLFFSVLCCSAAEFDLGARGTLSLTVPEDWKVENREVKDRDGKPVGYAINFVPRNGAKAKGLINLIYTTNGIPSKEAVRKEVLRTTEPFLRRSVEKKAQLKELTLGSGFGIYAQFTDASLVGKTPKANDYKMAVAGRLHPIENVTGVVTLAADYAEGKELRAMMDVIKSLKVKAK